MSLAWGNLLIIARQELRIVLRNRWIQVYAAVFALLALLFTQPVTFWPGSDPCCSLT